MANEIFTRIQLKYDSWANWNNVKDTFVPRKGEACVVNPGEDSTSCLLKVGDGTKTFGALPWLSALAADVYAWAKAEDVRLKDQKLEFFTGNNVIKTVDLTTFATEAEVEALLAGYKKVQTAVPDPTANGKSLTFIDTITQNTQGVITATKKNVNLDDYALKSDLPTDVGVMSVVTTDDDIVILTPETAATGAVTITGAHKDDYNTKTETTSDKTDDATEYEDSITIMVPTLEVDKYGHTKFLGETSHIITIPKAPAVGDADITIGAGDGLEIGSADNKFNVNQDKDETITLKHAVPTGAAAGSTTNDIVTKVTTDEFGHVIEKESTSWSFGTDTSDLKKNEASIEMTIGSHKGRAVVSGSNGIKTSSFSSDGYLGMLTIDGSELKDAIDANEAAIATLNGTDAGKSARAIATEVAKAEIGSAGHLKREIVDTLPAVGDADADTIYMVPEEKWVSIPYSDRIYDSSNVPLSFYVQRNQELTGCVVGSEYQQGSSTFSDIIELSCGWAYNSKSTIRIGEVLEGHETPSITGLDDVIVTNVMHQVEGIGTSEDLVAHMPSGGSYALIEVRRGVSDTIKYAVEYLETSDNYAEYMLIEGVFERIGQTDVSLAGYATENYVDNKLEDYKKVQIAKKSPSTNGTALEFIDTITQDAQGVISATKKSVNLSEYAKLTDLPEIPTNHKILQQELSGTLTGAQVVSTWSQNANGEIAITPRNLTPDDIGAQPVGNYKTKQSEVTKTGSTVKTVTSVKQNANGEITEVKFEDIAFPAPPTASGAATIAIVANDVVTLKAGAVLNENHTLANNASADITLAKVAKTGSIYDVKEGANDNIGSDKVAHPKYLIFNCGSATTVI